MYRIADGMKNAWRRIDWGIATSVTGII